jgi:hypothetical protein
MTGGNTRLNILYLCLTAVFFGGCSTPYTFKVDAINNPEIEGHLSFKMVSSNAEIDESNLQYKEVAEYVKTTLSAQGMYEAPTVETADMIVDIAYGIGEPEVDFKTYTTPVYIVRGGGYETRMIQVVDPDTGKVYMRTMQIYVPPMKEVVDFEERVIPITTYEKYLRLTSRDNRESDEDVSPAQVWSIYVKNKDESTDLRKYLPLLAAAAVPYVGANTGEQEEIKVKETDESVAFIKQGM